MLQDLENLVELQVADKEILRLKEEVAALPKRVAVIENKLACVSYFLLYHLSQLAYLNILSCANIKNPIGRRFAQCGIRLRHEE